jgi:hypothetical protein
MVNHIDLIEHQILVRQRVGTRDNEIIASRTFLSELFVLWADHTTCGKQIDPCKFSGSLCFPNTRGSELELQRRGSSSTTRCVFWRGSGSFYFSTSQLTNSGRRKAREQLPGLLPNLFRCHYLKRHGSYCPHCSSHAKTWQAEGFRHLHMHWTQPNEEMR